MPTWVDVGTFILEALIALVGLVWFIGHWMGTQGRSRAQGNNSSISFDTLASWVRQAQKEIDDLQRWRQETDHRLAEGSQHFIRTDDRVGTLTSRMDRARNELSELTSKMTVLTIDYDERKRPR